MPISRSRNLRVVSQIGVIGLFWVGLLGALVGPACGDTDDLFDLPLQDLLSLETTSVSKKSQPLSQAATAVFVITGEDLRRSGVSTIPDALRMVPGVQVAQIDGNKWAISARGFNGRFANKLLVLIDGRTVYTPQFAGVYWDVQDTLLEDIERIEVIRGPGATLWGANAVNGVINIITKSSADTQGWLLSGTLGTPENGTAALRYGGTIPEHGHYRFYAKFFDRDGNHIHGSHRPTDDDWSVGRGGFRLDLGAGGPDVFNLQGDYYAGTAGESTAARSLLPPYHRLEQHTQVASGGHLLGHWHHEVSETTDFSLQGYYDRTRRDWDLIGETRTTFDLDSQLRTRRFSGHDLLIGLGYRYTEDDTQGSYLLTVAPARRSDRLYSAFIQDDIELLSERLTLTLGSKFEHNDYSGFEFQPNVRILWQPSSHQSLWASVARAVSTPSRVYSDSTVVGGVFAPGEGSNASPLPLVSRFKGSPQAHAERVIAYEVGYRVNPRETLDLDIALYYNKYQDLFTGSPGDLVCEPGGGAVPDCLFVPPPSNNLLSLVELRQDSSAQSYGMELAVDWRPHYQWHVQGAYSVQRMHIETTPDTLPIYIPGSNPTQQLSLRVGYRPRPDLDLDLWGRYVDALDGFDSDRDLHIDSYLELDARLAWRPIRDLELSLVGRNLLQPHHAEFFSDLGDLPLIDVERSVLAKAEWHF